MKSLVIAALAIAAGPAHADYIMGPDVFVEDRVKVDPRDDGTETYLSLGVLTSPDGGWFGLRLQVDLISFAGLSLGVGGTLFGRGDGTKLSDATAKLTGVGYLAYTAPLFDRYKLRLQAGYGGAYDVFPMMTSSTSGTATTAAFQIYELSAMLEIRGNHDWSAMVGPIVQRAVDPMDDGSTTMLMAGLMHRW